MTLKSSDFKLCLNHNVLGEELASGQEETGKDLKKGRDLKDGRVGGT